MEDALAILAEELGLTIEQLTAEIEASCEAIEAEAKVRQAAEIKSAVDN